MAESLHGDNRDIRSDRLVGTFRKFGEFGPVYEVIGEADEGKVFVVVVETGERLLYPADQAVEDPRLD